MYHLRSRLTSASKLSRQSLSQTLPLQSPWASKPHAGAKFAEYLLCLLNTASVLGSVWGSRGVSWELLSSSEDRHRPEIAAYDGNIDRSKVASIRDGWGRGKSASGEEPAWQCRRQMRCRFDPWVGKIPQRKAWQPTPVFLPGKFHGPRSLVGCSPRGYRESELVMLIKGYSYCG